MDNLWIKSWFNILIDWQPLHQHEVLLAPLVAFSLSVTMFVLKLVCMSTANTIQTFETVSLTVCS